MATRVLISAAAPKTYAELKRGVEETLLAGQRRVERAKVLTYWETGRLINAHVLINGARASYGSDVIRRLARDLSIASTTLYQCTYFADYFPIPRDGVELVWAHYRLLCQIDDQAQREKLTALTIENEWTSPELEERVRALNARTTPALENSPAKILAAKPGIPGLHPVVARRDGPALSRVEGLAVDLGFKMYLPLAPDEVRRLKLTAGSIVRSDDNGELVRDDAATKADLFTYRARDVRVVDGDTLAVTIELPPFNEIDKKLRLRGINCAEMDTPAGKAAKRFVQNLLDRAKSVIIATTKPDKYDRYLADVFLVLESGEEIFLNNALLENGHAVRMDGSTPKEWELSE